MSGLLQPSRRWSALFVWLFLCGSLLFVSGCLSYKAELASSDPKTPGEVLEDSSDLTDPSDVDDNPTEPSSPSEPDDESDDPFDSWEADPDFVFDECAYQCTSEGPICDYESCDECTGCCPCDLGDRESVCAEGRKAVLYCVDGCFERLECAFDEVCNPNFPEGDSCEPCLPCSEPGESYCDIFGERDRVFVCNENFCLIEDRCTPGTSCMYSRRPFTNEFGGQCSPSFPGCEEELCSGFPICDDEVPECGPCGCCDFNNARDFCAAGPEGTYVLEGVNRLACYEIEPCGRNEACELTPGGEAGYCADF